MYSDQELLTKIAEGDEKAFKILFDTYRSKLYTYILKITESKEAAEDAVHDVFLKIWTQKEKLLPIQNINAYLYRMAYNHAYNGFRRMAKKTLVMSELEKQSAYEPAKPDEKLVRKEVLQFIDEAAHKLTPQQQQVFRMSRELGLKQEDIAQQLNISIHTVKKHLTDALHFMRKELLKSYGNTAVALYVMYGYSLIAS